MNAKPMTSAQLIAEIQRLDPDGTMPIGLSADGGQIRPLRDVAVDTLHVSTQDPTFATRGRYMDTLMTRLCDQPKGSVLVID